MAYGKGLGSGRPIDPRLATEGPECLLHGLGQGEELIRDLDPRGDPVDDLGTDGLRIARGTEAVSQARDAVGDISGLVATRQQDNTSRGLVGREVIGDLEDVEDLTVAEDVDEHRCLLVVLDQAQRRERLVGGGGRGRGAVVVEPQTLDTHFGVPCLVHDLARQEHATEQVILFERDDPLVLDSGATLAPVKVADETYGKLNAALAEQLELLNERAPGGRTAVVVMALHPQWQRLNPLQEQERVERRQGRSGVAQQNGSGAPCVGRRPERLGPHHAVLGGRGLNRAPGRRPRRHRGGSRDGVRSGDTARRSAARSSTAGTSTGPPMETAFPG